MSLLLLLRGGGQAPSGPASHDAVGALVAQSASVAGIAASPVVAVQPQTNTGAPGTQAKRRRAPRFAAAPTIIYTTHTATAALVAGSASVSGKAGIAESMKQKRRRRTVAMLLMEV